MVALACPVDYADMDKPKEYHSSDFLLRHNFNRSADEVADSFDDVTGARGQSWGTGIMAIPHHLTSKLCKPTSSRFITPLQFTKILVFLPY